MPKKKTTAKPSSDKVRHNAASLKALASRVNEISTELITCAKELETYELDSVSSTNHETTMRGLTYLERFSRRIRDAIRKELEDRGHYSA